MTDATPESAAPLLPEGAPTPAVGEGTDAVPPAPPPARPSAALAALLGWWVPGLGHAYLGRGRKGLFFAVVVLAAYGMGLVLGDFRCVSWERDPFWFVAQSVVAVPTALAWALSGALPIDHRIATFDIGLLYTSVAALLNAVVVADAIGIADERQTAARAAEEEAARRATEAQLAAAAAAAEVPVPPASFDMPPPDSPPIDEPPADAPGVEPPPEEPLPEAPPALAPPALEEPPAEASAPPTLPRADEPVPPQEGTNP